MTLRWLITGILAFALVGCMDPGSGSQMGLQIMTLTENGPQLGLPGEADTIRFLVMEGDRVLQDDTEAVFGLQDLDGDGPTDREARIEIPPDIQVSITAFASKAIRVLATARADGVEIENGGRRFVKLTFSPVQQVSKLPYNLPTGRFGHAAVRIPGDGRILISGGFTSAILIGCPPALSGAEVCFQLQASSEAFLLDPSDGSVYPTLTPMLRPRALHTATSMAEGRVLVAGGVDAAIMGLFKIDGVMGNSELRPRFVAVTEANESSRTFEIFDPTELREADDIDQDGDPQAGAFVGTASAPTSPGPMNTPRFLHAAARLPEPEAGVLLVGGQGSAEASVTGEVFLARRAGGAGFVYPPVAMSDGSNRREWPAAALAEGFIYVVGGAEPPTNALQIIDRWVPDGTNARGQFQNLTTCPGWSLSDQSNNALVGAKAVVLGRNPRRVLVVGWMGPLCSEPPDGMQALTHSFSGSVACSPSTYVDRSFTIGIDSCTYGRLQNPAAAHALGAVAELPLGQALIAGGFQTGQLDVTDTVEVLTGEFAGSSNLATRVDATYTMERGRAWHTATPLYGGRVLLIGGMNFTFAVGSDLPQGIELSNIIEVYDPGYDPSEQTGSSEEI